MSTYLFAPFRRFFYQLCYTTVKFSILSGISFFVGITLQKFFIYYKIKSDEMTGMYLPGGIAFCQNRKEKEHDGI